MTTWNARLEWLLAGLLFTPDDSDPLLAWDWGDSQPFAVAVGHAECDNGTLVDTQREMPVAGRAVDPDQLQVWLHTGTVAVLDLRTPEEYAAAHIPHARQVAADNIAEALATLPDQTPVVLVCRSGRRSQAAAHAWQDVDDWKIYHLQGGMLTWNGTLVY